MMKIVHAQTLLPEDILKDLKEKTGEEATKDALAKAIDHYLICPYAKELPRKSLEVLLKERQVEK